MVVTRNIFLTLGFILFSLIVSSQGAILKVEISNDTLLVGNYIQIKYTLENANGNFEMPELDGLRLVAGPNTSSSMSVINGKVEQSSSYSFYLEPLDIGMCTISPAYFNTDQGTLESQPISISVIDNPDGVQMDPNHMILLEEVVLGADGKSKKKKRNKKRFKI